MEAEEIAETQTHDTRYCEHGGLRYYCRICKGGAHCEHGCLKYYCRECQGKGLCEHNHNKYTCRLCQGAGLCEHNKLKSHCRECGSVVYCIHDRRKYSCVLCGGSETCEHKRLRANCRECKGHNICEHDRIRTVCRECKGTRICEHDKRKDYCVQCKGSQICEHNIQKRVCRICKGAQICEHDKNKQYCKICNGSALCKSEWCETRSSKKYKGYCLNCFIHLFPDEKITTNYKTKEKDVSDRIMARFPNFSWVADKRVVDGCSRRRPDLLLDMGSHIIIVEVDEHKHEGYDCSCENKRLMEISQDLQHRPIVFIRFNPDAYTDTEGNLVKSCWSVNGLGLLAVPRTRKAEWEQRIEVLFDKIQHWIDFPSEKTVEIVELFY